MDLLDGEMPHLLQGLETGADVVTVGIAPGVDLHFRLRLLRRGHEGVVSVYEGLELLLLGRLELLVLGADGGLVGHPHGHLLQHHVQPLLHALLLQVTA